MKLFFIGCVVGALALIASGFLFINFGGMPVATRGGPLPLEKFVAHLALRRAIGKEADRPAEIVATESVYVSGAKIYANDCAVCHGMLTGKPTPIALGLFPPPPGLMPPEKGVTDDPVGATFWKIKNGIRLTGMPGFEKSLTDQEIWSVSLLLRDAHSLPEKAKALLQE